MNNVFFSKLYQETILRYNKHPKNFGKLENACCFEGQNKMCGDFIRLFLHLTENKIEAASFEGEGCAILKASASMMTDLLKGKFLHEIDELFDNFKSILENSGSYCEDLKEANVFAGLSHFHSRAQCALLPWETLINGI